MGEQPVHDNPTGAAGDGVDFTVTSSGGLPPEPEPAAAPPTEPPPATEAAPDEGAGTPAVEGAPAADPTVAAAAKELPKGDSKAGKTMSDRARVIQAEIHQLTSEKYRTKAEAEAERAQLAELRAERQRLYNEQLARQQQQPPPAPSGPQKPKSENFDTFEDYSDALGQYYRDEAKREAIAQAEQLIAQTLERERANAAQAWQQQQLNQIYDQHHKQVEAARAAHPDFDEVVAGSALPTNPMMETHIPRSSVSGELLHYLATHPDECVQIAQMDAGPTLVALGRLEERISAVKSGSAPVRKPVSQARPPIKPVGAASSPADEIPDAATSSLDEHAAYWNRKDVERRRSLGRR